MTVKSLLVKISADASELQGGLDKAKKGLEAHEAAFRKVGLAMTAAGGIMTAFFMKAVDAAAKEEAAQVRLETMLKNVKTATEGGAAMLIQYAGALQAVTGYEDEEIVSAQAMLATFQLNEKQIAAITPRLLDMAAATEKATGEKQDLQAIAIALGKGFTGMAGSLSRYGVVLSDETKKTGDFNAILKDLDMNFKGASEAAGKTFQGQLRILKATIGDVVEKIGAQLIPVLIPLIQKGAAVAKMIISWMDAHQGLLKTLVPVIAGLGVAMTVLGPLTMVLPKIIGGVLGLGKALLFLAANPAALAFAAVGALAIVIYKLTSAMKEAAGMEGVFNVANKTLVEEMLEASQIVGLVAQEFMNLEKKYKGNAIRMKEAILAGKEGKKLQEQLIFVMRKHGAVIDEQGQAYDKSKEELDKFLEEVKKLTSAGKIDEEQTKKIIAARGQLADEIAKATMKERDYQKFAITAAYEARKTEIKDTITDAKEKGALLVQAEKSCNAQLAALGKQYRDEELQGRIDFAKEIADQEDQQTVDKITAAKDAAKDYLAQRKQMVDAIRTMNMSQLEGERYMIEQEHADKIKAINDNLALTDKQKADLTQIENDYYAWLIAKNYTTAQIIAEKWREQIEKITQLVAYFISGLDTLFSQAAENEQIRLDNEEKVKTEALSREYTAKETALSNANAQSLAAIESEYAAKAKAIEDNIKDEEKKEAMLSALEKQKAAETEALKITSDEAMNKLEQERADAEARIAEDLERKKLDLRRKEAKQQKAVALLSAIVNTASAIVEALPNIPLAIAVGIMGAAQVALIARQPLPLAEGGLIKKPTYAMLGEEGPELVLPLKDLKPAFAMAGGGVTLRQSIYFYGNINNAGDLDEISRRLAERTVQAISKGRRY